MLKLRLIAIFLFFLYGVVGFSFAWDTLAPSSCFGPLTFVLHRGTSVILTNSSGKKIAFSFDNDGHFFANTLEDSFSTEDNFSTVTPHRFFLNKMHSKAANVPMPPPIALKTSFDQSDLGELFKDVGLKKVDAKDGLVKDAKVLEITRESGVHFFTETRAITPIDAEHLIKKDGAYPQSYDVCGVAQKPLPKDDSSDSNKMFYGGEDAVATGRRSFALADGVSGHKKPQQTKIFAQWLVDIMVMKADELGNETKSLKDIFDEVMALRGNDPKIKEITEKQGIESKDVSCTLTVVRMKGDGLVEVLNIGDSGCKVIDSQGNVVAGTVASCETWNCPLQIKTKKDYGSSFWDRAADIFRHPALRKEYSEQNVLRQKKGYEPSSHLLYEWQLQKGDRIVMFSDGIEDNVLMNTEQFKKWLDKSFGAQELAYAILQDVDESLARKRDKARIVAEAREQRNKRKKGSSGSLSSLQGVSALPLDSDEDILPIPFDAKAKAQSDYRAFSEEVLAEFLGKQLLDDKSASEITTVVMNFLKERQDLLRVAEMVYFEAATDAAKRTRSYFSLDKKKLTQYRQNLVTMPGKSKEKRRNAYLAEALSLFEDRNLYRYGALLRTGGKTIAYADASGDEKARSNNQDISQEIKDLILERLRPKIKVDGQWFKNLFRLWTSQEAQALVDKVFADFLKESAKDARDGIIYQTLNNKVQYAEFQVSKGHLKKEIEDHLKTKNENWAQYASPIADKLTEGYFFSKDDDLSVMVLPDIDTLDKAETLRAAS